MKTPDEQITYTQVVDEKSGEIKYVPNTPPPPPPPDDEEGDDADSDEKEDRLFDPFRNAVEDIIIDDKLTEILARLEDNNKRLRYANRLQNGKLDGRRLCAFKTSDRLFKKKAIKHKNYQFTIMVDTSGSMFEGDDGDYSESEEALANCKLAVATKSVVRVVKALEDLKIPVSVVAMNNETRLLKPFDSKFDIKEFMARLKKNVMGSGDDGKENMGGTEEMVAYKETVAYIDRNTKGKTVNVVLVLSDGAPGGKDRDVTVIMEGEPYLVEPLGSRIDALKSYWTKQTKVDVYGIGIMSSAGQIPRSRRLDSVEKLPEVISNLIQEIIM